MDNGETVIVFDVRVLQPHFLLNLVVHFLEIRESLIVKTMN